MMIKLRICAFSVYDTKPVHFISTSASLLKWVKKKRKVYDSNLGRMVEIEFLRTELQNDYNNNMNDVDISDQLRKVYCFNRWLRNRKWWWVLFMWGLGVILVNSYVAYVSANTLIWREKRKDLISHYEYRKAIALALICPQQFYASTVEEEEGCPLSSSRVGRPRKKVQFVQTRYQQQQSLSNKAVKVSDNSLNPINGALRHRLNNTLGHFPNDSQLSGRKCSLKCALHRWYDRDIQIRKQVIQCVVCGVALCRQCFRSFHTIAQVEYL